MSYFTYSNNALIAEEVEIKKIVESKKTPFFCYSSRAIKENYNNFKDCFSEINAKICFSLKSNSNLSIVNILSKLGAGADVVSEGEFKKALKAKINPENIIFSGIGKTEEEIALAINNKCSQINIESSSELNTVNKIAEKLGIKQNIAIRINPDVNANTHDKITTGTLENKFGIPTNETFDIFCNHEKYKSLNLNGIAFHIGSNINELSPFEKTFKISADLIKDLKSKNIKIENIDVGGGIGIEDQTFKYSDYKELLKKYFDLSNQKIILEPGRSICANAAILVSKILYIKRNNRKKFIIIDAGMNDMMRTALYDSEHKILPLIKKEEQEEISTEIVGPICETADKFLSTNKYNDVSENDYVAILNAGAYGSSMSSNYNSRPLLEEVMIEGKNTITIRKRQAFDDMIKDEILIDNI